MFYSDCDDFFILNFIIGMSTKLLNKNLPPSPIRKKKERSIFFFLWPNLEVAGSSLALVSFVFVHPKYILDIQ